MTGSPASCGIHQGEGDEETTVELLQSSLSLSLSLSLRLSRSLSLALSLSLSLTSFLDVQKEQEQQHQSKTATTNTTSFLIDAWIWNLSVEMKPSSFRHSKRHVEMKPASFRHCNRHVEMKPASFRHISTASFRFVANRAQSLSYHSCSSARVLAKAA
jgi:hypothetical protein